MSQDIIEQCKASMSKRMNALDHDLGKVRTGRASITLLDGIKVSYYGNPTPLNQVATLSTPDPKSIVVSPFEKKLIQDIEKAIMIADIGLQPTNDGNVVRIPIPALTEERRKELVKKTKALGEDAKISIRQARRDANDAIKKLEKNKELNEDDSKRLQQDVQKQTDSFIQKVDEKTAQKEKEVMTI